MFRSRVSSCDKKRDLHAASIWHRWMYEKRVVNTKIASTGKCEGLNSHENFITREASSVRRMFVNSDHLNGCPEKWCKRERNYFKKWEKLVRMARSVRSCTLLPLFLNRFFKEATALKQALQTAASVNDRSRRQCEEIVTAQNDK